MRFIMFLKRQHHIKDCYFVLQECAAEHQDWRKCQDVLKEFKVCMDTYYAKKGKLTKNL